MTSVYFFTPESDYPEIETANLPDNVKKHFINNGKIKNESYAAFSALCSMGAENLRYSDNGKPLADNCFVSISHSGDVVAVVKSDVPVGIDAEKLDTERDFKRLSKRFFSPAEQEYFLKRESAERFYEIWTRKESYCKISGEGLDLILKGLDTFSINDVRFATETVNGCVITLCEKIN